jgi:hypothetical protein
VALVVGVAVRDGHGGDEVALAVNEGHLVAFSEPVRLILARREGNGHTPHQAVREVHRLDDGLVVLPVHKAG